MIIRQRLQRAFEQWFGAPRASLIFRQKRNDIQRVVDPETGSWADYKVAGSCYRRVAQCKKIIRSASNSC